ncbi:uncharacterized protein LOC110037773 [Phalaenopsis equestris]|uniref:uncharacterized protein LOC110035456 n=1 Tax=Phalaenopsis equestris TaxID=78828 RepID=UPI0009E4B44D|nr:uncharacterized protein LOC110035456 [Phalaenopsis equestris]XP_020598138.1 uncharacterized protein LOC110037773 [Phalaenopsis equestris]
MLVFRWFAACNFGSKSDLYTCPISYMFIFRFGFELQDMQKKLQQQNRGLSKAEQMLIGLFNRKRLEILLEKNKILRFHCMGNSCHAYDYLKHMIIIPGAMLHQSS